MSDLIRNRPWLVWPVFPNEQERAHILRCVNNHEKLLAALKGLVAPIGPAEVAGADWCRVTSKLIKAARAAIAEAEEQTE